MKREEGDRRGGEEEEEEEEEGTQIRQQAWREHFHTSEQEHYTHSKHVLSKGLRSTKWRLTHPPQGTFMCET